MSQEVLSLEGHHPARSSTVRWQGIGLKWKIASAFFVILSLLVLLLLVGVYVLTGGALRSQIENHASAVATILSDAAAGIMTDTKPLELHVLVTKYARLDGVAYAFIENAKGETAAHSLGVFPEELRDPATPNQKRQPAKRAVSLKGVSVHETRIPILEGQLGSVHLGIWEDAIEDRIRVTFLPLVILLAGTLLTGMALSVLFAAKIIQPVLDLRSAADKLSRGDLETPVWVNSKDEMADIASSLERMRASLRAAMSRLSRE